MRRWGALLLAAPVLAMLMNMDASGFAVLLLAMLLGTPSLSLIGAIGGALVLGARRRIGHRIRSAL